MKRLHCFKVRWKCQLYFLLLSPRKLIAMVQWLTFGRQGLVLSFIFYEQCWGVV
uniref:Uncharacterized protein n=1 Tax=Anguilla anguilla TaxID=7936 RepID=A0A0E9ULQ4_ANGAN